MAVLIALMARIPPLERGVGADRLARWHAMGGRYTVGLVVAHALLITWGYAVTAHTSVTHQTWTLLDSYPDVLLATAGGLLLVVTGVVSARAVAAPDALRDLVLPALLHLPGGRARVQPPVRRRRGVHEQHRRAGCLVGPVHRRRGGHHVVPVRHPGTAGAPAPAAGHGGQRRGARRGVDRGRRPSPGRSCGRSPGSSSAGGSSPATCGGPRHRTRCQSRPGRTGCASPSRRPGTTAPPSRAAAGHARRRRGPVRRAHRGGAAPPQGAADRRRGRHHAAAGAARVAAGRAGRPHPDLPGEQPARRRVPPGTRGDRRPPSGEGLVRRGQPGRTQGEPAERR